MRFAFTLFLFVTAAAQAETHTCEFLLSRPDQITEGMIFLRGHFEGREFQLKAMNPALKPLALKRFGWDDFTSEDIETMRLKIPNWGDSLLSMRVQVETAKSAHAAGASLDVHYPPIYTWLDVDDRLEDFYRHVEENFQRVPELLDKRPRHAPVGFTFEPGAEARKYMTIQSIRGGLTLLVVGLDVQCERLPEYVERGEHLASPLFIQTQNGVLCRLPVAYFVNPPEPQPAADEKPKRPSTRIRWPQFPWPF